MLELIKKYTGVTYDLKGLTDTELSEIIYALEDTYRRNYRDYFEFTNANTLVSRLKQLKNYK